jgi:orotidine-5'-phosphate decarboxylase
MAEVIVALDLPSAEEALAMVDRLPGLAWAKVGPTLFVRSGPALIAALRERGIRVFLDLKWHDIPHQVGGAVRAAADEGVDLVSVHALGGARMLAEAARVTEGRVRVVAVSVLTSHTAEEYGRATGREIADLADEVRRLAGQVAEAGLDGMVCAPAEARAVREVLGPDRWVVVPGIRPRGSPADDQRRAATPEAALAAGASHLVVGRPVIGAEDPGAVYHGLCEEAE